MTKKRGRPKGTHQYTDEFLLSFLKKPMNAAQIQKEINKDGEHTISWNTIIERFKALAERKKVTKVEVKNKQRTYHIYLPI